MTQTLWALCAEIAVTFSSGMPSAQHRQQTRTRAEGLTPAVRVCISKSAAPPSSLSHWSDICGLNMFELALALS